MSENNEYPVIVIGEKQYLLDYSDITGLEWKEVKKLTKLGAMEAIGQASMLDMEVLGALVFVIAKREDKTIKFDDVLGQLNINSVKTQDELDEDIVARQIREAAHLETDQVLKKKLWLEYERYRSGLAD